MFAIFAGVAGAIAIYAEVQEQRRISRLNDAFEAEAQRDLIRRRESRPDRAGRRKVNCYKCRRPVARFMIPTHFMCWHPDEYEKVRG